MVWIDSDRYIELLSVALRVSESRVEHAQMAEVQMRSRLVEVLLQLDAERSIADRTFGSGVEFSPLERQGLISDVPAAAGGRLDRAAFVAVVDEHIWARRLAQAVAPATAQ